MTAITLLDGSIGQEAVRRSGERPTNLWSTRVMMERPDLISAVHADYFAAGATIATANTYALHRDRLARAGLEDRLADLVDCALGQAEKARAAHGTGRIAGSLGPLGASYRPGICPPPDVAADAYRELVDLLAPRVDLLLIETAASVRQAEGALRGCRDADLPVWLAVTVDDEDGMRLRSGERVEALERPLADHAPAALLINCSRPEAVTQALDIARGFGRPFGAYANGFTRISEAFLGDAPTVDALDRRSDLGPDAYADFAMHWLDQGATILGGCCEVGPAHIAEIAGRLRAAGHDII